MIFRIGVQMDVVFVDFSRENPKIINPLTLMSQILLTWSILGRNYRRVLCYEQHHSAHYIGISGGMSDVHSLSPNF